MALELDVSRMCHDSVTVGVGLVHTSIPALHSSAIHDSAVVVWSGGRIFLDSAIRYYYVMQDSVWIIDDCQGKYLPLGSSKQDLIRAFFVDVWSVPLFLVAVCNTSVVMVWDEKNGVMEFGDETNYSFILILLVLMFTGGIIITV